MVSSAARHVNRGRCVMQNRGGFNLIPLGIGLIAIAFMAARGCEEGPFGRKRVVNLSVKEEFQLGAQAYNKILSDERGRVIQRGVIVDTVRRVGRRLADASTDSELREKMGLKAMNFEWQFNVVDS